MADSWGAAAAGAGPNQSIPLPLPHEGYIWKKGHKVHNWKKRYAIFNGESQVLSYFTENPNVDPSGKRSGSGLGSKPANAKGTVTVQTFEVSRRHRY